MVSRREFLVGAGTLAFLGLSKSAIGKVSLGDLKTTAVRETHFVYPQKKLLKKSFVFSKCLYADTDTERYNATWDKSI